MLTKKQIQIGKKLCFILRHDIVNSGLDCDLSGYVKVKDLLYKKLIDPIDDLELMYIVENNDKKRLSLILQNDEYYIKANQGHSLKVGNLINDNYSLQLVNEPYDFCAHGTEEKYIELISKNGLNRCLRKHIHLVSEINKEKQISGFKKKSNYIIVINMDKCMKDGMIFYKSENNVILTEGFDGVIDPKYFLDIIQN